jgi:hypothetical protein
MAGPPDDFLNATGVSRWFKEVAVIMVDAFS